MKHVALGAGFLAAAGAAVLLVVYLCRWEWQRALVSGMLLLAIEGVLVCSVLLLRIGRLEQQVRDLQDRDLQNRGLQDADGRYADVRRHLERRPQEEPADGPFAWLADGRSGGRDAERTYVFVPVLVVAGAALSGVAWLIRKAAEVTVRGAGRRFAGRSAGRLVQLTAPPLPADARAVRLEDRPAVAPRRPKRVVGGALAVVLAATLLPVGYYKLADATQTREQQRPAGTAATTVVFRVEVKRGDHGGGSAARLAAHGLWEQCRTATSARLLHAPLSRLERDVYAGVVRPGLSPHNLVRLRGCLTDVRLDRVTARVLGEGQAVE